VKFWLKVDQRVLHYDPDRSQVIILTRLSGSQRPVGRFLMGRHKLQRTIISETDESLVRKDLCRLDPGLAKWISKRQQLIEFFDLINIFGDLTHLDVR
jgi:hypothetical protein